MDCLLKLYRAEGFSDTERIVAQHILRDPEGFMEESAQSLAASCDVSLATVYRVCSKLDASGIAGLKAHVAADVAEWKRMNPTDIDFNFPVKPTSTAQEVVDSLKGEYETTVTATAALVDPDELERCAAALWNAREVDVYTSAGSISMAQNFRFQMLEIGRKVNVPIDEYEQRLVMAASDSSHLAIVISFGGRGSMMLPLTRALHKLGTPILLIASADDTPLDEYADYRLRMAPLEDHSRKLSSFATRLTTLFLLDVLYGAMFRNSYDENFKTKRLYYRLLSTFADENNFPTVDEPWSEG